MNKFNFLSIFFLVIIVFSTFSYAQTNKWIMLQPGQKKEGYHFKKDGTLSYKGKPFNQKILSQKEFGDRAYLIPDSILISVPSPNGLYALLQVNRYEFNDCLLLDLGKKKITNANKTHYGPSKWVMWSPEERFAILHDPEAGLLQRMDLETKKIIYLPVAERDYIKGIDNISKENTYKVLSQQDLFGDVDINSFFWITGTSKFRVKVYIQPGKLRYYMVEVDVQTGNVREI